jgi:hypothetical protein
MFSVVWTLPWPSCSARSSPGRPDCPGATNAHDGMHMTELMPRHPSESRPFGGRLQHAREQLRFTERLAFPIWEHQIVGGRSAPPVDVFEEIGWAEPHVLADLHHRQRVGRAASAAQVVRPPRSRVRARGQGTCCPSALRGCQRGARGTRRARAAHPEHAQRRGPGRAGVAERR